MLLLLEDQKTIEIQGPFDITESTTDAIVNAANSSLLGGGGVDGAIHRAGGPAILAECRQIVSKIGRLPAGQAVMTTGGRLAAKYVIHTVGPIYREGTRNEAETLASCHREAVRLADEKGLASISARLRGTTGRNAHAAVARSKRSSRAARRQARRRARAR